MSTHVSNIRATECSDQKLWTVKELADFLNLSPASVNQHARGERQPVFPCRQFGRSRRFSAEDVAQIVAAARVGPEARA